MERIDEMLAESFIAIFEMDYSYVLDTDPKWISKVEGIKSNNDLNAKGPKEIIALISAQIEYFCLSEKPDIQGVLTFMAQNAFLYSRAFEKKMGSIISVFNKLVANYNKYRTK